MKRIIIGITGATGTIYGWRLMEMLREEGDTEIHLVMSAAAKLISWLNQSTVHRYDGACLRDRIVSSSS